MSKLSPLSAVVARYVSDGASVVMGSALECLIPFAAGHEMIRQGKRDLTLIGPISDILFDQLIGAGCVRRVIAAWVGNVAFGLGRNFRRAVEEGSPHPLEVEDHSNFSIALALEAGALGVPYLPTRTLLGSGILSRNTSIKVAPCPFTGQPLVLVPALTPDVAILIVQRSDENGNAHCWGPTGVSAAAARASRHTILLAEEIVDADVIRSDPNRVVVPGFRVNAVVHAPRAGHPSPVQGCYNRDHESYAEYARRTRASQDFLGWLHEWVLDVKDHDGYLTKLGRDRLEALRVKRSRLAAPVEYGS
ncbi:MAG TPA: CoA-transferase [Methylomirabilota bacterium]|nr:CoA-transferase [Methylomirabilota bacterium]